MHDHRVRAAAAYSIVANDSIQTLGTFLSSNAKRPWWLLWGWISLILVVTVFSGWISNGGDPAFGRLSRIDLPLTYNWLYVVPPLALVILTRSGIPVSTSFLVLTAFSSLTALQLGGSAGSPSELFRQMLTKSIVGYMIAFAFGLAAYGVVITAAERTFLRDGKSDQPHPFWFVFQWLSTGFLWSMWLVQDLANVFVYLPRQLPFWALGAAVCGMVLLLGILIRGRGGRIQRVVTEKTNTLDLRSATLIDMFYGLILLFFKVDYIPKMLLHIGWSIPWPPKMPMSTTWVFLGLLAGREFGIWLHSRQFQRHKPWDLTRKDLGKVVIGTLVSLVVAFGLPAVATMLGHESSPANQVIATQEAISRDAKPR